jgi:hypothetical protein
VLGLVISQTFYKLYFVHSFWLANFGMDDATSLLPIKNKKKSGMEFTIQNPPSLK